MAESHDGIGRQRGTPGGGILDDETISKVGKALRQVAEIKEAYTERLASASTEAERQDLALRAENAALQALDEQGLSVDRYDEVITAAQTDPDLERRVLTAARLS
ncbi:MAG: DUF4168 domain-containing protein [Acetobacteraceae bacterium]|nr:DUF4168 domain-containing protein [Acetobacteraceae bacterium]